MDSSISVGLISVGFHLLARPAIEHIPRRGSTEKRGSRGHFASGTQEFWGTLIERNINLETQKIPAAGCSR